MKHPLPILILCLIFKSLDCSSQVSFNKILPDTSKTKQINWFYDQALNYSNKLGIASINNGVDSFALRLWISSNSAPDILISIWHQDQNWLATKTYYWTSFSEGQSGYHLEDFAKMRVDSSRTFTINPMKDFSKVIDTLTAFNILEIPTEKEIPDLKWRTLDGDSYTLEISTTHYYKIVNYSAQSANSKDNSFCKKINDFINFINRRFR